MGLFDQEADYGASNDDADQSNDSDGWGVDDSADDSTGESGGQRVPERTVSLAEAHVVDDDPNGTLKRAVDREAGVVIYAYKNSNAGGVTAIPLSETDLDLEAGQTD